MLAFLLAAGLGSRLRPLTDHTPKCLVPIGGRPLLFYWLELLAKHGVDRVLINSHYLHGKVDEYLRGLATPIQVTLAHEATLLGTAGTLRAHRKLVGNENDFFVGYADNLTTADITDLRLQHQKLGQVATLGLFRTASPSRCGIVELDDGGIITHFEEKPERPKSDLAFAGLMIASPQLVEMIPDQSPCDLGKDVMPHLVGKMGGVRIRGYLRDIGTPEDYQQAQHDIRRIPLGAM